MLRHCVMFKWNDTATDAQKKAMREALAALPGQIPEIRALSMGDDTKLGGDTYDFMLMVDFDDAAAYQVYADHPQHLAMIRDTVRPVVAGRATCRYEL